MLNRNILATCFWLSITVVAHAQNPRHVVLESGQTQVKTLDQNWSDEESNWFYDVPQGSRVMPYNWFLHLEQPGSQEKFRDVKHIQSLGYIPRTPDTGENPDGLPIGFVRDAAYDDGTPALGLTCAACHTGLINYNGVSLLIDGGPTLGDFERLMKSLAASLQATAADEQKFQRFANAVQPAGSSPAATEKLRFMVRMVATTRATYNERNLPQGAQAPFGHGRVDAFGAIFNEVSVTFLDIPGNWHPADAPVSYPCLWDAPQHNRVQWNGAAENRRSSLGVALFGTDQVGATGRNTGEVLGVFGNVYVNGDELLIPRHYKATANKDNLIKIEDSLRKLWSPQWPEDILGPLDAQAVARGRIIYERDCAECHADIDRMDPDRQVEAKFSHEQTDPTLLRNFGRLAHTGRLAGRLKTILSRERFGTQEPVGAILKHVVERVLLKPQLTPESFSLQLAQARLALKPSELIDQLNPGYRMTGTINIGDRRLVGQFESLAAGAESIAVRGGSFALQSQAATPAGEVIDLRTQPGILDAVQKLQGVVSAQPVLESIPGAGSEAVPPRINAAQHSISYKARPLNGIWATAPYLHNGSVRSLADLLKPQAERKPFHVGSREFDPQVVGFKDDPAQPLFDTQLPGNSSAGHLHGTELAPSAKQDLLEYLKSL